MAWRLLTLLFHSLAVVWADASILTPPHSFSACWISIKMEKRNVGWIPWMFSHKLLRKFKQDSKILEPYEEPDDSTSLYDSGKSQELLLEAEIRAFKRMTCYAKPSKDVELKKCHDKASEACPSNNYRDVLFIYGIQQQQKDVLHESLQRLPLNPTKAERIVLFIDCQEPTVMDMRENPTNCQGGLRLEFDPSLHATFYYYTYFEMRSGKNCSDPEIYPGGMLARKKLKWDFDMEWEDDISFDCGRPKWFRNVLQSLSRKIFGSKDVSPDDDNNNNENVHGIRSTKDGVVLLESNVTETRKMIRQCVLKNEATEGDSLERSLWIRHGEEALEQKLQPRESVTVKPLPHIEIYPFFAVPEALVEKSAEKRERSKKPLYAFHFKLLQQEAKESDKSDVQFQTEQLIHEKWLLKTANCRKTKKKKAFENCRDGAEKEMGQDRKVFVSSGNRKDLTNAIETLITPFSLAKDWEEDFKEMQRKYKFIKVGKWDEEEEIPDPKPVDRKLGRLGTLKCKFYRLLRLGTSAQIDVQPLPELMKKELHLDVALFQAYTPRPFSYAVIGTDSSGDVTPCFGFMTIRKFYGTHRLYTTEITEKGVNMKKEVNTGRKPGGWVVHSETGFALYAFKEQSDGKEKLDIELLHNVFKVTFSQIKPDSSLKITCTKWPVEREDVRSEPNVHITASLDIDVRTTSRPLARQ